MYETRMSKAAEREAPKKLEVHHLEIMKHPTMPGGHLVEGHTEGHDVVHSQAFGPNDGSAALMHVAAHVNIKHDMPSMPEAENETGGAIPDQK